MSRRVRPWVLGALLAGGLAACSESNERSAGAAPPMAVLAEVFETPPNANDDLDSLAVWHGPGGRHWLLASAKRTGAIVIADAASGAILERVGGAGSARGRFARPNGLAVAGATLFVVERDRAQVRVLGLPHFTALGTFGGNELRRPYGIALAQLDDAALRVFVTDDYRVESAAAVPGLGERVREYRVRLGGGRVQAELAHTFGARSGAGALRVVESIAADAGHARLLIADERSGASAVRVYDMTGEFTGRQLPAGHFRREAEGIALYACADGGGHWVATDQSPHANAFHVFDRVTLAYQGSFRGRRVANTDGIALTQRRFGPFTHGALYAVHDDRSVVAFAWRDIAAALGLRADCSVH